MTSSFSIDQAEAVIGGFLLLILLVQILKKVLRRRRIRDRAEGPLNEFAIPEDPHVNHVERDQTEGVPNGMLVLPDDPLMQYSTAQSHAIPYYQHQLVDLHVVPWHIINDNNDVLTFEESF